MRNDTKKLYPENWKEISKNIRELRNNKCEFCKTDGKEKGNPLTVHHLDYNPQNNDPENLKLLCAKCHLKLQAETRGEMLRVIVWRYVKPLTKYL